MSLERPQSVIHSGVTIALPQFFASISSLKTNLPFLDYLEVLAVLNHVFPAFLISSFDIYNSNENQKERIRDLLDKSIKSGSLVLLDSGNYESYWYRKQNEWTSAKHEEICKCFPHSFALGFDVYPTGITEAQYLDALLTQVNASTSERYSERLIPIIHGNSNTLPTFCSHVACAPAVSMIAVPEREMGDGLIERALTISKIRDSLDLTGRYVALHVLGTGNPLSMAAFVAQGADSFDGLEWCQTVVDFNSAALHHFSHVDLFSHQTAWHTEDLTPSAKGLAHNLEFYAKWLERLRSAKTQLDLTSICKQYMSCTAFARIAQHLKWQT